MPIETLRIANTSGIILKALFLSLSIGFYINSFSQIELPDSLSEKAKQDSLFVDLIYETAHYSNGSIRYEGWSYEIASNNEQGALIRIGLWKFHDNKGGIILEEFSPYEWDQIVVTKNYKNGLVYFEWYVDRSKICSRHEKLSYSQTYKLGVGPPIFCAKSYYLTKDGRNPIKREFCKTSLKDKDGNYIEYFKNGQVKVQGLYNKGKKVGDWIWFNESGVQLKSKNYI